MDDRVNTEEKSADAPYLGFDDLYNSSSSKSKARAGSSFEEFWERQSRSVDSQEYREDAAFATNGTASTPLQQARRSIIPALGASSPMSIRSRLSNLRAMSRTDSMHKMDADGGDESVASKPSFAKKLSQRITSLPRSGLIG